tara:strand:- start:1227 stop:2726 length:1500 start_codon:yes stop_codon:yes gene_type:complete
MEGKLFVILGNQLFEPQKLKNLGCKEVFMAEDYGLCSYEKHHKLKLYFFLCAMREYKDELQLNNIKVHYFKLGERKESQPYVELLKEFIKKHRLPSVHFFEIEDKPFEATVYGALKKENLSYAIHRSPMFMFSREEFKLVVKGKKVFRMSSFYQQGRKKFNILLDESKKPLGGKWSFDEENRKKVPAGAVIPPLPQHKRSAHHEEVSCLIKQLFHDHPGNLENIWFPVTRKAAAEHLEDFLKMRAGSFGTYEDAMVEGKNFLFHSCLSVAMNAGLLSPSEVIQKLIGHAKEFSVPMNSLEGFIRQILGWREFIRGVYQEKGDHQLAQNYWGHKRKLSESWSSGSTGLAPLDDCVQGVLQYGYSHHISRLMVISNLMNLCEIDPKEIYRWFMKMYIDSSEWVMVPNVFGMATYADGGLMSTKPYACGSNYILKMSNYKKGPWCDVVDGLYWRFMEKNKQFYRSNPRLSVLVRSLDKMADERKTLIFEKAERFIRENTKWA